MIGRPPASPFDRGLSELELGLAFAAHGTPATQAPDHWLAQARRYFIAAGNSFESCGSASWQQVAEQELADIGSSLDTARASAVSRRWEAPTGKGPLAADPDTPPTPINQPDLLANLTEREVEIASLVAAGLPNREVAQKLHLSVRTVEVHLSRVFSKLNLRSRVELSILVHRMPEKH